MKAQLITGSVHCDSNSNKDHLFGSMFRLVSASLGFVVRDQRKALRLQLTEYCAHGSPQGQFASRKSSRLCEHDRAKQTGDR